MGQWATISLAILLGTASVSGFAERQVPPTIDGIIDPSEWGPPISERFFRYLPSEEGDPSERTAFYLRQDEKALYFAFRCETSNENPPWAPLTKRDQAMHSGIADGVFVLLDTTADGRSHYLFGVSARGVQEDGINQGTDDMTWDGIWDSAAKIDDKGYTVEIRIPFSTLRFSSTSKEWHVAAVRFIPSQGEWLFFPKHTRAVPDFTRYAMRIEVAPQGRYGERAVMPFVSGTKTPEAPAGKVGADLVMGVGKEGILNVTLNPDFGQVEADVPQFDVNNRYPLYYPEKRPFFLEHMDLFGGAPINFFYTRQVIDPVAGVRYNGDQGKNHYTVMAVREKEEPGVMGSADVNDFVTRWTRDLYANSYIGGCLLYRGEGGVNNAVAGVDGNLRFGKHAYWSFDALYDQDATPGQRTSGSAVDTTAGYSGVSVNAYLNPFVYSQSFVDRLGYIPRNNFRGLYAGFSYTFWLNRPSLVAITPGITVMWAQNTRHVATDRQSSSYVSFDFGKNRKVDVEYMPSMERWEGVDYKKRSWALTLTMMDNKWVKYGGSLFWGDSIYYNGPFLGKERRLFGYAIVTPNSWLRVDIRAGKDHFDRLDGSPVYDVWVGYLKAEWTIALKSFLRLTYTRSSSENQSQYGLLFGYIAKPGNVVYAGWTRQKNESMGLPWEDQVYVKVGHRFDF